jgi:hypothetical protein
LLIVFRQPDRQVQDNEFYETGDEAESEESSTRKRRSEAENHEPIIHRHPYHGSSVRLPDSLTLENIQPLGIFRLFFNSEQLEIIVTNTNTYASRKSKNDWNPVTFNEIKIWMGMSIYMRVHKAPSLRDYWNMDIKYPIHNIRKKITRRRFELIKRYIHISHPDTEIDNYYNKMEHLMSHVREAGKKHYIPDSKVFMWQLYLKILSN